MSAVEPIRLRERQAAATRQQIMGVAMEMLTGRGDETFSHETIAKRAGVGARTVYRYFPHRSDLMQALWVRVREETKTRFPAAEEEIVPVLQQQFEEFDRHEALVRATLTFSAGIELRDRGSLEGRPAFRRSLAALSQGLTPAQQRRLVAVCLAIYSAPFWQLLRARGELSGEEASEAGAWAIESVLNAARLEARRNAMNRENGRAKRRAQANPPDRSSSRKREEAKS
ncbi:MAG TPA: TetR/AcrR family transcriptional regulator [Myxococcota bacterium]|nr:TetR/AcrR family transcriptional regulator [Myxococcota bacterium]